MKIKKFQINFLILFLGITVVSYLTREILNLSNLIYNSLSDKLSVNQINEYFELQDKLQWVSYVFIPVVLLIKTTIIAYILYIGAFFYSKIKVTFKQLFK